MKPGVKPFTDEQRKLSFVKKLQWHDGPMPTACWLWTGPRRSNGYGGFYANGRMMPAHRYIYENAVGPIPDGLVIDHLCRVRLCMNPKHMEPVSNAENIRRGVGVTAQNAGKTHCIRGHAFTESNVRYTPKGERACRQCFKAGGYRSRSVPRVRRKAARILAGEFGAKP